jgi:hypothetical protein
MHGDSYSAIYAVFGRDLIRLFLRPGNQVRLGEVHIGKGFLERFDIKLFWVFDPKPNTVSGHVGVYGSVLYPR